jgi:hypothetical protein
MQTDSAQKPEKGKKLNTHVMLTKGIQEQVDAMRKHQA